MGEVAFDNYPTPQPLADAMTHWLHEILPQKTVLIESGCGEGNFVRVARVLWPQASHLGVDLLDYSPHIQQLGVPFWQGDFLTFIETSGPEWWGPQTLVYGNPPYGEDLPQRFIESVFRRGAGTHVAYLLRQGFLGGVTRAIEWYPKRSLRLKRDVAGRPKFNVDSKHQDHSEYGVFVYEAGYRGHYLGWEEPLFWKASHIARRAKWEEKQARLATSQQVAS